MCEPFYAQDGTGRVCAVPAPRAAPHVPCPKELYSIAGISHRGACKPEVALLVWRGKAPGRIQAVGGLRLLVSLARTAGRRKRDVFRTGAAGTWAKRRWQKCRTAPCARVARGFRHVRGARQIKANNGDVTNTGWARFQLGTRSSGENTIPPLHATQRRGHFVLRS